MRETVLNLEQLLRDVTGSMGRAWVASTKVKSNSCTCWNLFYQVSGYMQLPSSNHHLLSLTYATLWKFGKIQYCDNFFVQFESGLELWREILVKIEIEFRLIASLWMVLHQQAISLKANIERGICQCTRSLAIRSGLVCLTQKLFRLFALLILSQMFRSVMQISPALSAMEAGSFSLVGWHRDS